jgi:hypothetical protein
MASEFRERNSATVSGWTSLVVKRLNTVEGMLKHGRHLLQTPWAVLEDWSIISRRPAVINILPAKPVDRFLVEGTRKVLSGSL